MCDDNTTPIEFYKPRLVTIEDFQNPDLVDDYGYMGVWAENRRWNKLVIKIIVEALLRPENRNPENTERYWSAKPSRELMEKTPWE